MSKIETVMVWIAAVILFLAALASGIAAWIGYHVPDHHRAYEAIAAILGVIISIGIAGHSFFWNNSATKPEDVARGAIAFLTVVFLVMGFACLVVSTEQWPVAALWGGACLLGGGFIGLLFGVPLQSKAQNPAPGAQTTQERARTLLADAADAVGKFLTGAAAVKYNDIYAEFKKVSQYLANCLQCCAYGEGKYNSSLAAGVILYFAALGFVAGILLPQYYMKDMVDPGKG